MNNTVKFWQLDVFTTRAGGGNPLGVVIGADDWSAERMQSLATWLNLVETTFVLSPEEEGADYRVRMFTPHKEIPYAGHPSVGTAYVAVTSDFAKPQNGQITQQCGVGLVPLKVEQADDKPIVYVRAPDASILETGDSANRKVHEYADDIAFGTLGAALVDGGRRWWAVEFANEAALRAYQPNHERIADLGKATDTLGICGFARSDSDDYQLVTRAWACAVGIKEDPASGAANGLIAASIVQRESESPLKQGYRVSQGREIGHNASLDVRFDDDGNIWVGGQVQEVISGELCWPK